MKSGMKERITGYCGERSVERFFLLQDINCRLVEFDTFDCIVYYAKKHIKVQVKTSEKDSWKVNKGKHRNKNYTNDDTDIIAIVRLKRDGVDEYAFYIPEELPSTNFRWTTVKEFDKGMSGWINCVSKL